ncbi:MAG TPA: hypothetical protein VFA43_06975 [Gemmatimonadaceae bacterium]|nr:hypothetical protein [Gemmatimonadaceae bacterium]
MRSRVEDALRVLVLATLGWYLMHVLRVSHDGVVDVATSATLDSALVRWSTRATPPKVAITMAHPPRGVERDWLAALNATATTVAWSGPTLVPTAIAEAPRADPMRGATVTVAAPAGADVVLADTLGIIDSMRAISGGVHATLPHPRAAVDARVGDVVARAALHDSLALKRLLIFGTAIWETKFTVAALEERGWTVDARFGVSPRGDVHQGDPITAIDTARYAAVIAIDSTVAPYAERIVRFVHEGGGLILWPAAAQRRAFASLVPATTGATIDDEGNPPSDSAPRAALELVALNSLTKDAVVLDRRGDVVAVAARRIGLGRVIESGYTTLWRWRMDGGAHAPDAHREWLAGLVAGVAHAGRFDMLSQPTDVAPLATLIDRLGPPSSIATGTSAEDPTRQASIVLTLVAVALLAEWLSRRLRGVK